MEHSVIVGLFNRMGEAQGAVNELISSGFRKERISVLANPERSAGETNGVGGRRVNGATSKNDDLTVGKGAMVGGATGFAVALGAMAIPGIGPVLAAGPIATALAGTGTGAVLGGLAGPLVDMGIPDEDADTYMEGVQNGKVLVTVDAEGDDIERARDVLDRHNAIDIKSREAGEVTAGSETSRMRQTGEGEMSIPVVEEELAVGKRPVMKGGVRVYNRVTQQPVEREIELREERVNVSRTPTNRPATEQDFGAFKEGEMELTETSEEPVVGKEARVVEEVRVGKEAQTRVEKVRDTVRKTDVRVDPMRKDERRPGPEGQAPPRH